MSRPCSSTASQLNNNYLFCRHRRGPHPPYSRDQRNAQGQITAVAYNGNTAQDSIPLSSTASISSGSDGATNQGLTSFMNDLVTLRDALSAGEHRGGQCGPGRTSSPSEGTITNAIAGQGAVQMRIQVNFRPSRPASRLESLTQLVSGETGADLPKSTVVETHPGAERLPGRHPVGRQHHAALAAHLPPRSIAMKILPDINPADVEPPTAAHTFNLPQGLSRIPRLHAR